MQRLSIFRWFVLVVALVALFGTLPALQALPVAAQTGDGNGAQVAPTEVPTAAAGTPAPRKRLEAPPLNTPAATLLVGSNVLLAIGVVIFAWYLRRRQRNQQRQ